MEAKAHREAVYRFGIFEADVRNAWLLRRGSPVKIQEQPFRLLMVLLRRPGEIVTREELRQELWPADTYVDFEGSVKVALKRLRQALGDSAENPAFVETVPKRGYRFIAPVDLVYPQPAGGHVPASVGAGREPRGRLKGETPEPAFGKGNLGVLRASVPEEHPAAPVLVPFPASGQSSWPRSVVISVAALLALAILSACAYFLFPAPPPRVLRKNQLTHFGRAVPEMGMVTDGARIYFSEVQGGRYTVDQVPVNGGEPAAFALPFPNAEILDISPDHTELLVYSFSGLSHDNPLWIVPVTGGASRRLGNALGESAAWSPDGQKVAYSRGPDLFVVRRDGTASRRVLSMASTDGLDQVRWSPSGRMLGFTARAHDEPDSGQWEVGEDGSGLHRPPLSSQAGVEDGFGSWTPDGKYFVYRSAENGVWHIRAIRESGEFLRRFSRQPVELYSDVHFFLAPLVSVDGRRIFFIEDHERRELVRYDPVSRQFVPYLEGIFAREVTFSNDGQRVAYTLSPDYEVWLSATDGKDRRPLTFLPFHGGEPHFSPDGRLVAFGGWGPGKQSGIYLLPAEGGGQPEQVLSGPLGVMGWSHDGQTLLFWKREESNGRLALYAVSLKSRQVSLLPGSEGLHHGALSPDGLRVAALSEDNRWMVLYDLQTHQRTDLAKGAALGPPCWGHNGKVVFFQDIFQGVDQPIYRVRVDDRRTERITSFAQPFAADVTGYRLAGVTPDDHVLASLIRSNSDLYALDVDLP